MNLIFAQCKQAVKEKRSQHESSRFEVFTKVREGNY